MIENNAKVPPLLSKDQRDKLMQELGIPNPDKQPKVARSVKNKASVPPPAPPVTSSVEDILKQNFILEENKEE